MKAVLVLSLCLSAGLVAGQCERKCSGHGQCNNEAVCTCFTGYFGADCSLRDCPKGVPWAAKAFQDDSSGLTHSGKLLSCSNTGICDYSTGACKCSEGYTGDACQYKTCPVGTNDKVCSGRGSCQSIAAIGALLGPDGLSLPYYDGTGPAYTNWEKKMLQGCMCEPGWTGADCSVRQCPYGDSAQTTGQQRPAYRVRVDFSDVVSSANRMIKLRFAAQTSLPLSFASGAPSSADCLSWLSSVSAFNSSETACIVSGPGATSPSDGSTVLGPSAYELTISLGLGYNTAANTFFQYSGKPSASLFGCYFAPTITTLGTTATTSYCTVATVDVTTLTLHASSSLPSLGTSYVLAVSDDTTSPNKFKTIKTVAGSPAVVTTYGPFSMTAAATGVDVGDGLKVYWSAQAGHARDAEWGISSTGITSNGVREYELCGRAGTCEQSYGTCQCYDGYGGPACDKDLIKFVGSTRIADQEPILDLVAPTMTYASSILRISSLRPLGSGFNFVEMKDPTGTFFSVSGDGYVTVKGINTDAGFLAYMSPTAAASYPTKPTFDIRYATFTTAPTNGIFRVRSDIALDSVAPSPVPSAVDIVNIQARRITADSTDYTTLMRVRNSGETVFSKGGVTVTSDYTTPLTTAVIGTAGAGLSISGSAAAPASWKAVELVRAGSSSLTIDNNLDITSTDALNIQTTTLTTGASNAAGIAVVPGGANNGIGGILTLMGGASAGGAGGAVTVAGGASAGAAAGGAVTIAGGASSGAAGGNVVVAPGAGVTHGSVVVKDASSADRITVTGAGVITLQSRSTLTLQGSTAGGTNAAGTVLVAGGTGDGTRAGGAVRIKGGTTGGFGGGDTTIADAADTARFKVAAATSTFLATDGAAIATFNTGADVANSDLTLASQLIASGAVTATTKMTVKNAASSETTTTEISSATAGVAITGTGSYSNDYNGIIVTGPSTGTYNAVKLVKTGGAVLTIDQDLDISSTDLLNIQTASGAAGINIKPGDGTTGVGGPLTLVGGDTTGGVGGLVKISGGISDTGNGGSVTITGGASTGAAGGGITMRPGDGATKGNFVVRDTSDADRLKVTGAGVITLDSTSTLILKGAAASGAAAGTVLVAGGAGDTGNAGGQVQVLGGASGGASGGGAVQIAGGAGTATGVGGSVRIRGGASGGAAGGGQTTIADAADVARLQVTAAETKVLATDGNPTATFATGANVAGSSLSVATAMSVSGLLSVADVSASGGITAAGAITASAGFAKGLVQFYTSNGATVTGGDPSVVGTTKVKFGFNGSNGPISVDYGTQGTISVPIGAMFPIYS